MGGNAMCSFEMYLKIMESNDEVKRGKKTPVQQQVHDIVGNFRNLGEQKRISEIIKDLKVDQVSKSGITVDYKLLNKQIELIDNNPSLSPFV